MGNILENWIVFYKSGWSQLRNWARGHRSLLMRRQPIIQLIGIGMSAVTPLLCDDCCQIADI